MKASSEVLKITGRIYPATAANVALEATLADGTHVIGETKISKSRKPIRSVRLRPRKVKPMADTLAAIAQADLITLGPGSLVHQRDSESAGGRNLRRRSAGRRP